MSSHQSLCNLDHGANRLGSRREALQLHLTLLCPPLAILRIEAQQGVPVGTILELQLDAARESPGPLGLKCHPRNSSLRRLPGLEHLHRDLADRMLVFVIPPRPNHVEVRSVLGMDEQIVRELFLVRLGFLPERLVGLLRKSRHNNKLHIQKLHAATKLVFLLVAAM